MAELVFFTGTMDCGKSTLALQTDHNHSSRGRMGLILTSQDRAGEATLSSRLGLAVPAVEVRADHSLWESVTERLQTGERIDYLIADEAQFYTSDQVDDMARRRLQPAENRGQKRRLPEVHGRFFDPNDVAR